MTQQSERDRIPSHEVEYRGFHLPGMRVIRQGRSGLADFLGGLLKHHEDGSIVIDVEHPDISEVVKIAKNNGHDVVLELGENIVAKTGQFLANHPRYVDAAKVAGVLGGAASLGTLLGIALYKHNRPDSQKNKHL